MHMDQTFEPGGFGAGQFAGGPPLTVADTTVALLSQTRPWVRFLSIMAFIGSGFLLLGGVAMMGLSAVIPSMGFLQGAAIGVMYVLMAALYIYPALLLNRYAGAIGALVVTRSAASLDAALDQQKRFWRFVGIMTIGMACVYALALVGLVIFAILVGFGMR